MTIAHHITRFAYRRYRAANRYFMSRPPTVLSRFFYWFRDRLQAATSVRRLTALDRTERRIWKAIYFQRFGTEPLYVLETAQPVATDSADHKWPRGTLYDSNTNRNFNLKLYALMNHRPDLRVLDLGCAGGGFVKTILEDGYTAVGIEGSDVSKKLRSGEWDTCPHHLLTGDITSRFQLRNHAGEQMQFHCITAWEVLEHIPIDKVSNLIDNAARHLTPDGIFVASVDTAPDGNPILGAIYHTTRRPKTWWLEKFAEFDLSETKNHPFATRDYVRGHGMGLSDWDPEDGEGFHLVLHSTRGVRGDKR
jgi:2-polyprenyl-3-methyl-5-hydroxy-6-metoxy-1,4-benzoquinol methylase